MSSPLRWIREQIDGWEQSTVGLFRGRGVNEQWPLSADGPVDLKERLLERGHLLPLPTEPAALANLLEGNGEFDSQEAFETYWRASARNWKKSPEAEKLLRRALESD